MPAAVAVPLLDPYRSVEEKAAIHAIHTTTQPVVDVQPAPTALLGPEAARKPSQPSFGRFNLSHHDGQPRDTRGEKKSQAEDHDGDGPVGVTDPYDLDTDFQDLLDSLKAQKPKVIDRSLLCCIVPSSGVSVSVCDRKSRDL